MAQIRIAQKKEHPLQRYEQILLGRQKELQAELASTVEQAIASHGSDTKDSADQAVASYQKEILLSQGTVRNAQLNLIRQALNRIADGTFGECVRCGDTIGRKRIEAVPWTPYCIHCQERIEKGDVEPAAFVA